MLLTGAAGQLGRALQESVPAEFELAAFDRRQLDITDESRTRATVADIHPALVMNAAAYTRVDQAEEETEEAFATNAHGAGFLARAARACGARLIHVSTEFVFDGRSGRPYRREDPPRPLNVYGESKLAGEREVVEALPETSVILRTSWLYGRHGGNFVKTVLERLLHAEELPVVVDQVGAPTAAAGLARAMWRAAAIPDLKGFHHWADAGVASRYDLATAILEDGLEAGLLERPVRIVPILTEQLPAAAWRPAFGVLDASATWRRLGLEPLHWRAALRRFLQQLRDSHDAET